MDFSEKRLTSEEKYQGVIVRVRMDSVELCDGTASRREIVEHPGGVAVLPVDTEGRCTVVRQFRYAFGRELLEAPAGKLERGEDPREAALRELSEETGYTCDELIDLGTAFSSPGFCTEKLHLYLALGLREGKSHPDEGEFLAVEKYPLAELSERVSRGEIPDAKTQILILRAEKMLEKRAEFAKKDG